MAHGPAARSARIRRLVIGVSTLVITCGLLVPDPAPAQADITVSELSYDIPAQPLGIALATFARASRVNIAFESGAVAHLRSAPLRGRHPPAVALNMLLTGTGLTARFTGPVSAIVYAGSARASIIDPVSRGGVQSMQLDLAEVRASVTIGRPDRSGYDDYARRIELELRGILDEDQTYRGRVFRVRISVRINAVGRIGQVELVRGSGDQGRDQSLPGALIGRQLSVPPPAGIEQPLRFDITVNRLGGRG